MSEIQSGLATLGGSGWTTTESFTKTNVADQAVHPGEDSTLDRTWGGQKYTHSTPATNDALIKTGAGVYGGFNVTVVTATGTIDIRDATSAGAGTIIDTIPIATAAGTRVNYAAAIAVTTGIYIDYNGGATGTVVVAYL